MEFKNHITPNFDFTVAFLNFTFDANKILSLKYL